jgi:two-component system alkaline phosphatase synthesis response regulator PhoP
VIDILIVEDNTDIALALRENLELEGYAVETTASGIDALEQVRTLSPRIVILDLMLPDADGFAVLRELRLRRFEMPVLILSARADEIDKLRGFKIGADDYVTKPFSLREVCARVEALFRRSRGPLDAVPAGQTALPPALRIGDVDVDFASHTATRRDGELIPLRLKEFELLEALVRSPNRYVSRQRLLEEVWGYHEDVQTRTVDVHMSELRRKLERDPAHPQHLHTGRKFGYMFRP